MQKVFNNGNGQDGRDILIKIENSFIDFSFTTNITVRRIGLKKKQKGGYRKA